MRGRIRRRWDDLTGTSALRRRVAALETAFDGMEAAHHHTRVMAEQLALHRDLLAFDHVLAARPVAPGPTVSVVMATRDRAALLPALLASLDDPRIVVVAGEGEGCTAARNRALDVATGDLVTYLDDDNVLHPRWLEAVVWGFTRRPDVDVLYGARIADDHGRVHGTDPTGTPWVNLLPWDRARAERENLADMGALAHRAGLPEARFDPTLVCSGDWDLLLRLTQDRDPLVLPAISCIYATDAPGRLSDEHGHDHWDAVVRDLLGTPLDRRPGPGAAPAAPTTPVGPAPHEETT